MIFKRENVAGCVCVALLCVLFFAVNGCAGDANAVSKEVMKTIGQVSISDSISDHSDSNTTGSLAWFLKQIGDGFGTIELAGPKTYVFKNDLAIPKKVIVKFQSGAVLSVEKDRTLKFDGVIDAGLQQIFDGAGHINGQALVTEVIPQWFGAAADGIADDTESLQRAIDFACESRVLAVNLNRGNYKVTKQLNCTNTRLPGTIQRDGLHIYGSSFLTSTIIGDTGDNTAVMDISGSQWLHLDNFRIISSKSSVFAGQSYGNNPSTVGIFVGCGKVLPQSQNQQYHVFIAMHDDMKANGGKGTIGIWNFAAEENTYYSVFIMANRPIVLTVLNGSNGWEYKNSYVEQLSLHSLGMTAFTGECFLKAMQGPAITTIHVNSLSMQNTYIAGRKGAAVFDITGGLMNLNYSGTIEGVASLFQISSGELIGSNVDCVFGNLEDKTEPVILLGPDGKITNCDIKINCSGEPGMGDRNLLAVKEIQDAKYNGGIYNTTIKTNQAAEWIKMPDILKNNSKSTTISNFENNIDFGFPKLNVN